MASVWNFYAKSRLRVSLCDEMCKFWGRVEAGKEGTNLVNSGDGDELEGSIGTHTTTVAR